MKNDKMEELKNAINEQAVFICERLGIDTSGKNFKCPSGTHEDKKPSAHFYNGFIKCFTCSINWDCVSIIQKYKGVDFKEALQIGGDMLGLDTAFLSPSNASKGKTTPKLPKPPTTAVKMPSRAKSEAKKAIENNKVTKEDLEAIKRNASEGIGKNGVAYLKARGLDFVSALKAGVLESDNFVHPTVAKDYPNIKGYPALLFPVLSPEGIVTGYIARWTTENKPEKGKVQNIAGEGGLFGVEALLQSKAPVFLTEGEIDALTYIDAGYKACSYGSVSGVTKLLSILSYLDSVGSLPPLILSPDNDKQGLQALAEIEEGLNKLNLEYRVLPFIKGYKDANEAYTKDKEAFKGIVSRIASVCEPATEALEDTIERLFNEPAPPPLKSGFRNLDYILSGGLRAGGLVVVYGNPATGKTAFALQVADSVSRAGGDYMFFSLEITKKELLCRNLSRESFIIALDKFYETGIERDRNNLIPTKCLEKRQDYILAHALDQFYFSDHYIKGGNDPHNATATACIEHYLSKAGNRATVASGMFNITVKRIRQELDRYIATRGRFPSLVVVDYAQIISAPEGDNAPKTDKQVADYNIKELKKLAGAYQIPFLVVASVNRESYKNFQGLTMASAKESGGIEYTADVVLGLEVEVRQKEKQTSKEKDGNGKNNSKPAPTSDSKKPETYEQLTEGDEEGKKPNIKVFSKLIKCTVFKNRWGTPDKAYFDYKPKYHFFREVDKATVKGIMDQLRESGKYLYTGTGAEENLIENQEIYPPLYFQ